MEQIDLGNAANDGSGSSLREAGEIINNNFTTLDETKATVEQATAAANGVVWKATLAEVNAIDPLVIDTAYGVYEDGANNGYYYWDGTSATVTFNRVLGLVKSEGDLDSTNEDDVVTGSQVADYTNLKTIDLIRGNASQYNSVFDGANSSVVTNPITLQTQGDYLEFYITFEDLASNKGLGAIGEFDRFSSSIGLSTAGALYVRNTSANWLTLDGLNTSLALNQEYKIKLLWQNGFIEVYLNDVFEKNISTGIFIVANYGNAYDFFKGKIRDVKIKSGATVTIVGTPAVAGTATKVNIEQAATEAQATKSKAYVSYDPTGGEGDGLFTAYVQSEANEDFYFGFEIAKFVDTSDAVYSNQWRLKQCKSYSFDGSIMTDLNEEVLTLGESEFAYRAVDRSDFSGGWHGDEQLAEINFYIDGVRIDNLVNAFNLTPCSEFFYVQKSTIHEAPNTSGTPNASHPVEVNHIKKSTFTNSGFVTENRVEGAVSGGLNIETIYGTLIAVDENYASKGQTDDYNITTFVQDGGSELVGVNDNAHLWNEQKNTSVFIKSEFDTNNTTSPQFVQDGVGRAKYYRSLEESILPLGTIWNFTTTVKFLKK